MLIGLGLTATKSGTDRKFLRFSGDAEFLSAVIITTYKFDDGDLAVNLFRDREVVGSNPITPTSFDKPLIRKG